MNQPTDQLLPGTEIRWADIRITRTATELELSNSKLVRVLDLSLAVPRTKNLRHSPLNTEYASARLNEMDFSFMGYNLPDSKRTTHFTLESVEVEKNTDCVLDGSHVLVRLHIHDTIQGLHFVREYFIYPDLPILATRCGIRAAVSPNLSWSPRCLSFNQNSQASLLESRVDSVRLAKGFGDFRAVEFFGRSDYTNDFLREHPLAGPTFTVQGNLLFAEKIGVGGIFFLQEAPPSSERRDIELHDFRLEDETVHSCCWGVAPHEVSPEATLYGYRSVIGLYGEEELGGRRLLKEYLRTRFPQDRNKDFSIMVNPWGSGSFTKDLSEAFLLKEIQASSELGATHYQIDDGWQTGKSLSALVHDNQAIGEDFWNISKDRFPEGLNRVHQAAIEHGVELALWLAPSLNREFRDWKCFVNLIGGLHRKFGMRMFKIDGVELRTKAAEDNLEQLVRTLRIESSGKILFNFDTTAGQRAGYFLFLEYGNIFLENRYACHRWGQVYHPEQVLRNLWTLAQYVRPQTLQIEVTDYLNINREYYDQLGVSHPDLYSPQYWAAVTLFAQPLVWLSPSKLDPKIQAIYRDVLRMHLQHRDRIFSGEIFPVGNKPDGASITGFQSHHFKDGSGFLILYRELKAPAIGKVKIHFALDAHLVLTSLSDDSGVIEKGAGQETVEVSLAAPGSFRFFKYEQK